MAISNGELVELFSLLAQLGFGLERWSRSVVGRLAHGRLLDAESCVAQLTACPQ